jgi:hypothetical protein
VSGKAARRAAAVDGVSEAAHQAAAAEERAYGHENERKKRNAAAAEETAGSPGGPSKSSLLPSTEATRAAGFAGDARTIDTGPPRERRATGGALWEQIGTQSPGRGARAGADAAPAALEAQERPPSGYAAAVSPGDVASSAEAPRTGPPLQARDADAEVSHIPSSLLAPPPGVPAAAVDRTPEQQHATGARAAGGEAGGAAGAAHAVPPGAAAGVGRGRLFVGKLPSLHAAPRPIEVGSDTVGAPGGTGAPPKLEVPSATRAAAPAEESPPTLGTQGALVRGRPTRVRRPGAAKRWADEDCRALAPAELLPPGANEAAHAGKTAEEDGPGRARGRCGCAGSLGAGGAGGANGAGAGVARVLELGRALRDIISVSRERTDLPARPRPAPLRLASRRLA